MIQEKYFKICPAYSIWDDILGKYVDLGVWFAVECYFIPNYIIGKQDEWKDWFDKNNCCSK